MAPVSKKPDDERLKSWMEWYDRQMLRREQNAARRSEFSAKRFEQFTRDQIEALFLQRIQEGWSAPTRRRHQAIQGYRDIIVSLLIQRDGPNCGICHKAIPADEETIDHIVQKSEGGLDEATNVRLACRLCNIRRPRGENARKRQRLQPLLVAIKGKAS